MDENQLDQYNATWIPGLTKPVNIDPYIYPKAHGEKYLTRNEWATSPQMYHNEIMNDYVTNVSKNLSEIPYVGNVLAAGAELGAPIASGILSLPYELKQSFDDFEKTLAANPEQYNSLGSTASGILQAIDDQNPLSTVYNRTKGALRPLGRRLENTWNAIKNEFGGSAEAAEMPNQTETILPQARPLGYPQSQDLESQSSGIFEEEDEGNYLDMFRGVVGPLYNAYKGNMAGALMGSALGPFGMMAGAFAGGKGFNSRLTPAQQQANKVFLRGVQRDPQTGRMITGPFAGLNAPGSSFFGSKTPQEMANKQIAKYGKTAPKAKVDAWKAVVTGGRDPNQGNTHTGHGRSGMGRDPDDRMAYGGLATMFQRR